jgi:hypothetical protein
MGKEGGKYTERLGNISIKLNWLFISPISASSISSTLSHAVDVALILLARCFPKQLPCQGDIALIE